MRDESLVLQQEEGKHRETDEEIQSRTTSKRHRKNRFGSR